ncbi:unnamed protein product [Caenorhabditis auriculariae]|uniref:Uncharacterized protein n=1 Tax=Caenorhabditis auriculariae TaxID=2777116 RepID=A0A8S1HWG2_9PELO|nr:unnamed protein product [Caenorhabditis auriculariae]
MPVKSKGPRALLVALEPDSGAFPLLMTMPYECEKKNSEVKTLAVCVTPRVSSPSATFGILGLRIGGSTPPSSLSIDYQASNHHRRLLIFFFGHFFQHF